MTSDGRGGRMAWAALYAGAVLAPLAVAAVVDPFPAPRPRGVEFAVALGWLGISMAVLQFALVSRVRSTSRRFGSDRPIALHRASGALALAAIVAHAVVLGGSRLAPALNPFSGSAATRLGAAGLWAISLVATSAWWRRSLGVPYERWRAVHVAGAATAVAAATAHVLFVQGYAASAVLATVVLGYAALAAWLLVYRWLVRPRQLAARPWRVVRNDEAGASTRLLRLQPIGHDGLLFEAGQFAWLVTGRSAFSGEQHPLSMASTAVRAPGDSLEFAIKALGDWSSTVVPALAVGDRVWVDGPYGALSPRGTGDTRLVLIAGGIGIAPMRAILQTMAEVGDRRPVTLIYAAARPERTPFAGELEALRRRLDLDARYVFEQSDPEWAGERGRVNANLLRRRLGEPARHEYLVCGPPGMIDAVERDLGRLGVPGRRVQAERFRLV